MKRLKNAVFLLLSVAALELTSSPALACAACFGQSDSRMAQGMNMGIFALLFVITTVLCGVAGFFVYVARRSAQLEEAGGAFNNNLSQHQTNA